MNNARRNALIVKLILVLTFGLLGSAFAFGAPAILGTITAGCTEEVDAVIADCTISYDDGTTMYSPVYRFDYDGQTYTVESNTRTSWQPDVGEQIKLKVNPDDPTKTSDPKTTGFIAKIFRIFGYVFLGIGALSLLIPFHKWA